MPVKVRNYVSYVCRLFGSTFKEKLHVLEFLHYHLACTEVVCWWINFRLFPTFFLECCRLLEARFLCEQKCSLRTFGRIFVLRLEKCSLWRYFWLLRLLLDWYFDIRGFLMKLIRLLVLWIVTISLERFLYCLIASFYLSFSFIRLFKQSIVTFLIIFTFRWMSIFWWIKLLRWELTNVSCW